jgi:hypothetical protein
MAVKFDLNGQIIVPTTKWWVTKNNSIYPGMSPEEIMEERNRVRQELLAWFPDKSSIIMRMVYASSSALDVLDMTSVAFEPNTKAQLQEEFKDDCAVFDEGKICKRNKKNIETIIDRYLR